jgi:hypothetical protein
MSVLAIERAEAVKTAAESLLAADPTEWSIDEQAEYLANSQSLINQLQAMQHKVLAAFDASGGAKVLGSRTTSAWMQKSLNLTGPQAGSMVHTARALRDQLPETASAFMAGALSLEHIEAIRKAHRRLGERFESVEGTVSEYACQHNVRELRRLIDRVIDQYDPAARDREREDEREGRYVSFSETLGGWWRLDGRLDPAIGQKLKVALDIFSERSGELDPRSPKQRRCDALGEIADRALGQVDRPSGSSAVTILVTPDQLRDGDGVCWPESMLMSRQDLAIHSCTAQVSYVVGFPTDVPPRWEPLAVGMSQRYATPAQRRALAVRDGGCVHPGCTVRPERCIAHHIVHWRDGGPTDLPNLVLLCDFHHRQVHLGREHVVITEGVYSTQPTPRGPP